MTTTDIAAIVDEVQAEEAPAVRPPQPPHADGMVELPVGLLDPEGLKDFAEVRELNGYDEEAYGKAKNPGLGILALLERAVVSIGGEPATKEMLDHLTVGDRIELMLAIHTATWGDKVDVYVPRCGSCGSEDLQISISKSDIPRIRLKDKLQDRRFPVELPSGSTAIVRWPDGKVQNLLVDKYNVGEITTLLVTHCVVKIDDMPLLQGDDSARQLSIPDRREIAKAVQKGVPGPQLNDLVKPCPHCGEDVSFSLPVGALFPL